MKGVDEMRIQMVLDIVHNVRTGSRKRSDLRRCDCAECREALRLLKEQR